MRFATLVAAMLGAASGCRQILGLDTPTLGSDAATDSGLPSDDGYHSGTRLKLQWNDYGGTREYVGQYDVILDATCTPQPWADGSTYCTPPVGVVAFTDDACTQQVGMSTVGTSECPRDPLKFFTINDFTCSRLVRVAMYPAGVELTPPAHYYARDSTGACTGPFAPGSYRFFALGPAIQPAELVAQTDTALPGQGELIQHVYAGSDGSQKLASVYDTTLQVACNLSSDGACVPSDANAAGFLDETCTTGLASGLRGCPRPSYGARALQPGCADQDLHYFALGAAAPGSALYVRGSSTCVASTRDPNREYYTLGDEIVPAVLQRRLDEVPGRQVVGSRFALGAASFGPISLYDTTHETACSTIDGQCLPASGGVLSYYADPSCTAPIELAQVYSGAQGCQTPAPPSFARKATSSGCTTTYRVFHVGARHQGAVYAQSGTSCNLVPTVGSTLFDLGAEVPIDQFATATAGTDP
jgi:hypothetical protein